MSELDVDRCYNVALPLVKEAGKLISEAFYNKNKKVESKNFSDDLLTETDGNVEKLLISGLKKNFPDHRFIGEESSGVTGDYEPNALHPTWIIDPIDGTTNFVHGYPQTCTSVALWANNQPQVAFVYNPILGQLFTACRGKGAQLNGVDIHVSKTTELSKSLVGGDILAYESQADRLEVSVANVKAIKAIARSFRVPGSVAISLGYVAMGALDVYFEQGPMSWDYAAGVLLVQEAGGIVTNFKGQPFDLFGRRIIAAANKALVSQVAPLLKVCPLSK